MFIRLPFKMRVVMEYILPDCYFKDKLCFFPALHPLGGFWSKSRNREDARFRQNLTGFFEFPPKGYWWRIRRRRCTTLWDFARIGGGSVQGNATQQREGETDVIKATSYWPCPRRDRAYCSCRLSQRQYLPAVA